MRNQKELNLLNHCARHYGRTPTSTPPCWYSYSWVTDTWEVDSQLKRITKASLHLLIIALTNMYNKVQDALPLTQSTGKWWRLICSWAARAGCTMRTFTLSVGLTSWATKELASGEWWIVRTKYHLPSPCSPFWAPHSAFIYMLSCLLCWCFMCQHHLVNEILADLGSYFYSLLGISEITVARVGIP